MDRVFRSILRAAPFAVALTLAALPRLALAGRSGCEHTVEKGETVSGIAHEAGVSEKHLVAANPALKKNPNRLRVGQTLDICRAKRLQTTRPQKCAGGGKIVAHVVGRGETLGGIAAHYAVSRKSLRRYNKRLEGRANSMIRVGERLRVCTTLRRYTHRSWFSGGVQLPEGEGYVVRRPANAWGTPATVDGIAAAVARYREVEPDAPPVQIGDISRHNGGPLREHVSHQEGRDVDVGYVWVEPEEEGGRRTMDRALSWKLLRSFADDENVAVIFIDYRVQKHLYEHAQSIGVNQAELDRLFEYPRGHDDEAVFYHWPGHAGHFHVRYGRRPRDEDEPDEDDDAVADEPSS